MFNCPIHHWQHLFNACPNCETYTTSGSTQMSDKYNLGKSNPPKPFPTDPVEPVDISKIKTANDLKSHFTDPKDKPQLLITNPVSSSLVDKQPAQSFREFWICPEDNVVLYSEPFGTHSSKYFRVIECSAVEDLKTEIGALKDINKKHVENSARYKRALELISIFRGRSGFPSREAELAREALQQSGNSKE